MLTTVQAVVRDGENQLLEPMKLLDGQKLLVTLLPDDENQFWLEASQESLDGVWNNIEDDSEQLQASLKKWPGLSN